LLYQKLDDVSFLRKYANICAHTALSKFNPTLEIPLHSKVDDYYKEFWWWLSNDTLKDENGEYFTYEDKYWLVYDLNDRPDQNFKLDLGTPQDFLQDENVVIKPEIATIVTILNNEFQEFMSTYIDYCFACDKPNKVNELPNGSKECKECGAPDYRCPECDNNREGSDENCSACGYPDFPCPECQQHGYSQENGCDSCGHGKTCDECGHTPFVLGEACENCGYPNPCPNCGDFGYSEETGCENCGHGQEGPDDDDEDDDEEDEEIEPEDEDPIQASSVKFIKIANYLDDKGLYKIADRLFKLSKKF